MVSLLVQGGLGNMLFQVAFGINQSIKNDTFLTVLNYKENSKEIKFFHNSNPYEYLENIFHNTIEIFIPVISLEEQLYWNIEKFEYQDVIYQKNCNNIYKGYFQSEKYFLENEHIIKEIFKPKIDSINYVLNKYPKINDYDSVALHIRRGDYLFRQDHHPILPISYYEDRLKNLPKNNVYIFSDDPDWCKIHFEKHYNYVNEKDWISLIAMSQCRSIIIANSSFSWWAAKMSEWQNKNVNIFYPSVWFGNQYNHYELKDLIPNSWEKVLI